MKTALPNSHGQYTVDLGRKRGLKGQPRFYLGHDKTEAELRKQRLWSLWDRQQKSVFLDFGDGVFWDEWHLQIAELVRQGVQEVAVARDERGPETFYRAIAEKNRLYAGIISFVPDDPFLLVEAQAAAEKRAKVFEGIAAHVREGVDVPSGPLVADTLKEFGEYVLKIKTVPGTNRPTEDAIKDQQQIGFVRRLAGDLTTDKLTNLSIESLARAVANRPLGQKTGNPVSVIYAQHALKQFRRYLRWLRRIHNVSLPADWEESATQKVTETHDEFVVRKERVKKLIWTAEELVVIGHHAGLQMRAMLLVALNCAFGAAELSAMKWSNIGDDGILRMHRPKTRVFGQWTLWPTTRSLLKRLQRREDRVFVRETGRPMVAHTISGRRSNRVSQWWNDLLSKVVEASPGFRRLPFKSLRKTSSSAIRRIAGGEIAAIHLAHGTASSDDLLECYTDRPWADLFAAQAKMESEWKSVIEVLAASNKQ